MRITLEETVFDLLREYWSIPLVKIAETQETLSHFSSETPKLLREIENDGLSTDTCEKLLFCVLANRVLVIPGVDEREILETLERKADQIQDDDNLGMLNALWARYYLLANKPKSFEYLAKAKAAKKFSTTTAFLVPFVEVHHAMSQGDTNHALEIIDEIEKQINPTREIRLATVTLVLLRARLYYFIEEFPLALSLYNEAISLLESAHCLIPELAGGYNNLSGVYSNLKEFENEESSLRKALTIYEKLGDKKGSAIARSNLARSLLRSNKFHEALDELEWALPIFQKLGLRENACTVMVQIASIYAVQEYERCDVVKAIRLYNEVLLVSRSEGLIHVESYILQQLAHAAAKAGDFRQAYESVTSNALIREKIRDKNVESQLTELRSRHIVELEKKERELTEKLMSRILPEPIVARLRANEVIADSYDNISILFADIVGFTVMASELPPRETIKIITAVFSSFDRIVTKNGCEKIKTIGDGYFAVCGAPESKEDHAERIAQTAMDMMRWMDFAGELVSDSLRTILEENPIALRIGLHCGPVIAGVIGEERLVYDIYGDSVNIASRMESSGVAHLIHCSETFKNHLEIRDSKIQFTERGLIQVKGKGEMRTYFLKTANTGDED